MTKETALLSTNIILSTLEAEAPLVGFRRRDGRRYVKLLDEEIVYIVYYHIINNRTTRCSEIICYLSVGFRSINDFLSGYLPLSKGDRLPRLIQVDTAHEDHGRWDPLVFCGASDRDKLVGWIRHDWGSIVPGFFHRYGTMDKAIELWRNPTWFARPQADEFLAAALWLKGHPDEAIAHVEERLRQFEQEYERTNRRSTRRDIESRRSLLEFLRRRRTEELEQRSQA